MTNAVFDLSNMFFRSMFIVGGFGKKQYTFDSQKEMDQLMRKVATDVTSVIRTINPTRVIFALDSKSWRKGISIDENEGYKGNRTKSEVINWDNFYEIMNDFIDIVKENGFVVSRINNAEADDLMALWRDELLYKQNQHVILVSGDEDVRQLVSSQKHSGNKTAYSVVFNPFTQGRGSTKKLFAPVGFDKWLDDGDDLGSIFDRSTDVDKEDFKRILKEKVTLEEIDGTEIALRKVFCGDDGDNVPAIFTWIAKEEDGTPKIDKKTGEPRKVRITKAPYQKIVDYIGAKSVKDLFDKDKITSIEDQIKEISGEPLLPFKMKDRLTRQAKLVVLQEEFFPSEIVNAFKEDIKGDIPVPKIQPQSWNMLSMLEGTKYVDASRSKGGSEASIFGQVDRISNKELF